MEDRTWASAWTLLEERFGREHSAAFRDFYRRRIEARLDEDEFRRAVSRILDAYPWRSDQPYTFPRPVDFVFAVEGSGNARREALVAWGEIVEGATDHQTFYGSEAYETFNAAARAALASVGGIHTLTGLKPRDLAFTRREFLDAYTEFREPDDRRALAGDEVHALAPGREA